jgi:hypothetical protein
MLPILLFLLLLVLLVLFLPSFRSLCRSATVYVVKPILSATQWILVEVCKGVKKPELEAGHSHLVSGLIIRDICDVWGSGGIS